MPGKRGSIPAWYEADMFGGPKAEQIAEGVWRLAGDMRGGMNVYFLREDDGIVQFDAGTKAMTKHVARVAGELGELRRVVLGHAHSDHRGTAPALAARGVPVYCHPDEKDFAEGDGWGWTRPGDPPGDRGYLALEKIEVGYARRIYPWLLNHWDDGPVKITGTVSEGDEVGGFKVLHFPGHAPGLIGLWRESDRLAIVSDTVYFVDSSRFKRLPKGEATVPHEAFNWDTEVARASLRKLAALNPATVWAGHAEALEGPGVVEALERAAAR